MRSSWSLQRSLFKHQARQIAQQVQGASPHFRAYQRRYEAATRRYRRRLELPDVDARVAKADLVYVGDYHTLRMAQQAYLRLLESALNSGRRVVLALEFVETRHQGTLDAFLAGKL
ncbi:MAG TPA: ChaN family lipoprotein, partial [Archangium sp.]